MYVISLEDNEELIGYTSDRTLRRDVRKILDDIEHVTKHNPKQQIELISEAFRRVKSFKETALHSDYAWSSIQKSLQNFFSTIQDRYKGRYPNEIRAAQQIVCSAIANSSSDRKLGVIAAATGATVQQLSSGRSKFQMYLAGDIPTFFELRGKMRDEHMPDEWIDLAVDVWCEMT